MITICDLSEKVAVRNNLIFDFKGLTAFLTLCPRFTYSFNAQFSVFL